MNDERLSTDQIRSYALPAFGMAMVLISVAIYLPNYYTDELGMTAGMLSWVFLIGRVWDAITDPLMGHLSDRTRSRWGRRRPYFLVAALPIWRVFTLIGSPSASLSTTDTFLYLLVCCLAYLAGMLSSIPLWLRLSKKLGKNRAWSAAMVLGPAISADVIDSDELETGMRREGAFVGVWSFVDKAYPS